jgi:hypothetical protein
VVQIFLVVKIESQNPCENLVGPKMNSVLGKISSIFEYVRDESGRPTGDTQNVISKDLQAKLNSGMSYRVTAKVDGTCCWIHDGELWARQDIKKGRTAPEGWVPTNGTEPDAGGHLIGFRPLAAGDKWHRDALTDNSTSGLFIESNNYVVRPLSDFENATVELVGPKINGNKHGLEKHALIVHGSIDVTESIGDRWICHETMIEWLTTDGAKYEGVVVHMSDGSCYKTHRGHVKMNTLNWGVPLI